MKHTMLKIFMILLPVMALLLATTGDSVTVFDPAAKTTASYSYFDLIPEATLQFCTPLAAMLSIAAGILGVIFAFNGKLWASQGVLWSAFASATLAVVPVLIRGDVLVVPNALFSILMLLACVPAFLVKKLPADGKKVAKAPRLGKH